MITASFTKGDERLSVVFSGHAEYRKKDDIVCASASAIFYSLYGYLLNTCPEGLSGVKIAPGDARLSFPRDERAIEAFRMAYVGMYQLSETYPMNVECRMHSA